MNLAKKDKKKTDLYMLNASGQQELNTHLNNQMTTLTPPRRFDSQAWIRKERQHDLKQSEQQQKRKCVPFYISLSVSVI